MTEKNTHRPITPDGEYESDWQVIRKIFLPMLIYSIRHLTVGTAIRCRRAWLKWRGRKYYI